MRKNNIDAASLFLLENSRTMQEKHSLLFLKIKAFYFTVNWILENIPKISTKKHFLFYNRFM